MDSKFSSLAIDLHFSLQKFEGHVLKKHWDGSFKYSSYATLREWAKDSLPFGQSIFFLRISTTHSTIHGKIVRIFLGILLVNRVFFVPGMLTIYKNINIVLHDLMNFYDSMY